MGQGNEHPCRVMRRRVASRLCLLRAAFGWELTELAKRTGLDLQYLHDLEAGHSVTLAFLPRIAVVFGLSHLDLLDSDNGAFARLVTQGMSRDEAEAVDAGTNRS